MPFFFLFSFAGCAWGIGGQILSSLCRGWVLSLPSYRPGGCLKSFETSSFYVHTPLKKVEEKNAFLFGHVIKNSYLCN